MTPLLELKGMTLTVGGHRLREPGAQLGAELLLGVGVAEVQGGSSSAAAEPEP